MRHQGRLPAPLRIAGRLWPRALAALRSSAALRSLLAALAMIGGLLAAEARELTIRGIPENGFGRIELRFDQATRVSVRNSGTILVVSFAEPVRMRAEKLVGELGAYVSATRRDPDGTGIRLALARPFRLSQLEAGERVYLDLLPERWSGLPPALPPEVVAELAERARIAEARLKDEAKRREGAARPVVLRLAETGERTRLVFEPPAATPMRFSDGDGATELRLEGNLTFDLAGNRPKNAQGVADFAVAQDESGLTIRVAARPDRALRSTLDEGTAIIDLVTPTAASPPQPTEAPSPPPPAPTPRPAPQREAAVTRPEPIRAAPAPASAPDPFVLPSLDAATPATAAAVRPRFEVSGDETSLVVPFGRPTPAAAYERGGRTIVLFQTSDPVELGELPAQARAALGLRDVRHGGTFVTLDLDARPGRPLRLEQDGNGWRLAFGAATAPPDDVLVTRASGQDGSGEVMAALRGASVHWVLGPDDTALAVVTTTAREGLANGRRFVEFQLLPTIQGVVVQPNADGVQVALGRSGVLVTRKGGLALSVVGEPGVAAERHPFVIRSEDWEAATSGDVMQRLRALVGAASEAPRAGKPALRFAAARLLLANGLAHESSGMLAAAANDDPLFARRRETLLLSGIAALRAHRPKRARQFLADEMLGNDPEAGLWRAALDAEDMDWPRALVGLRRAEPVLQRYPEELVGEFRLKTVRAAVANGDQKTAEDALAAIERLPPGLVDRDRIELARATVDAAGGRTTPALAAYERLAGTAERPIAAEAALRAVEIGRRTARLTAEEAIARLESLAVSWRGDEVELGTLGQLVRLYGETRRWRDMLATARQATLRFPGRQGVRDAHDEAARWFEALFLGSDGASVETVEFLALYYDFREFAPVGRRGDEIVRRIADRLVEIDLLDQAATLLQHQVDHRLSGIARATIAARLAALRLMSGKPGLAITALRATRLTELPAPLRRLRLIIEAQAQADLSRVDLALEAVEGEEGADFARLRATIQFNARRWRDAGEGFEGLLGTRWRDDGALTEDERRDVIRAMLSDILAEEWIALERIRQKFTPKMSDSPDAKLFEVLLRPRAAQAPEFRAALREATRSDTLRRFLADWSRVSTLPPEPEPPPGKAAEAGTAGRPG